MTFDNLENGSLFRTKQEPGYTFMKIFSVRYDGNPNGYGPFNRINLNEACLSSIPLEVEVIKVNWWFFFFNHFSSRFLRILSKCCP